MLTNIGLYSEELDLIDTIIMNTIKINGEIVWFRNPDQIINMGGPWVGNLMIGNTSIIDNVLIDNILYCPECDKLLFVRYIDISKWQNDNYFTINYFDTISNDLFMFQKKFNQVFVERYIDSKQLTIYDALNNKDETKKSIINLTQKDFIRIHSSIL